MTANFNDGTMGDLDVVVPVSYAESPITVEVSNQAAGLPDADMDLYIQSADKSPGLDCAVLDTQNFHRDVTVSAVVGMNGSEPVDWNDTTKYRNGGAGVIAGSLAGRGCGYMLYVVRNWGDVGTGQFFSHTVGPLYNYQLILVRNDPAAPGYPLEGKTFQGVRLAGFAEDFPNYLRLTVQGTQVRGELWLNKTEALGSPDHTLTVTDYAPLAGYTARTYVVGRSPRPRPAMAAWRWTISRPCRHLRRTGR